MWKRDEAVKPTAPGTPATPVAPAQHPTQANAPAQPETRRQQMGERDIVNIGKSVVIKGELNGSEDLTVEGHVEGKIELRDHVLTIGPNGKIKAQVFAKAVIVLAKSTATSRPPKRSISATADRWTATSCHHAWPSRRARISAAPLTCSARAGQPQVTRASSRPQQRPATPSAPPQPAAAHTGWWLVVSVVNREPANHQPPTTNDGWSIIRRSSQTSFRVKRQYEPVPPTAVPTAGPSTKALAKFLPSLNTRSQPLLLDLGPVVGTNVTFFGEELGCKILVENLFKDIDCHITEGKVEELPAFFGKRFTQETGSVDGILCWDIFDYIDKPATQALTKQLVRILAAGWRLLAHFRTNVPPAAGRRPTRSTSSSIARLCSSGLTPPREASGGRWSTATSSGCSSRCA